ncbi:DUF2283 domain-containing protein [Microbispora hainanensis]|uniref:DUF2283 domain-containing protein n=1 Tax=Microbispora hainanensis TaxID=568844 RepID=A0A544YLS0_9ACTN|nr:DUF2283 domain-containing protein [Microbispora hainanensis]TQS17713.1 DUF2283 domain-containing protein [Microbispora hainanensis]
MRIEHDRENNVAYIYLVDEIGEGEAVTQIEVEDDDLRGEIVLDLDREGRLLGIEVLGASRILRPEVLALADDEAGEGDDGDDDRDDDGDDGDGDGGGQGGSSLPPYEPHLR